MHDERANRTAMAIQLAYATGMRAICVLTILLVCAGGGPAVAETWDFVPPACSEAASADTPHASLLACRAPTLRIVDAEHRYNRIGTPMLYPGLLFGVKARVDPEVPAAFVERREDRIAGRPVIQLVYRVHFEKIPLRFSRYFFEAHRNPGLIVMLTSDAETGELLFASTVHTCGCYLAIVPTDAVDPAWLPEDWPAEQRLFGQRLPGRLSAQAVARGLRITVESKSHRVTAMEAGPLAADADRSVELPLVPMTQLEALPIQGSDGQTGSFYYTGGPLRGHVRGSWNPWEGLTLFGLISLDPTVGMDKQFGDPELTGTPFYTILWFWQHERSRLDRMDVLLRTLGFRLPQEPL